MGKKEEYMAGKSNFLPKPVKVLLWYTKKYMYNVSVVAIYTISFDKLTCIWMKKHFTLRVTYAKVALKHYTEADSKIRS